MGRARCEIISDILKTVYQNEGCNKNKIIRHANLDWEMAKSYLETLVEEGYLERIESDSKGKNIYDITKGGEKLLEIIEELR